EVRRVATRRIVRLTFVLAVVGIALGGLAAFAFSDSLSKSAYEQRVADATARQQAEQEAISACLRGHGVTPGNPVSDDTARRCSPEKPSRAADDPRFHRTRLKGILQGVGGALAIVGWALGASLVGAEFASRGMTTLLTWENRRWRVFLT